MSNIHINSGISGAYITMPDLVVGKAIASTSPVYDSHLQENSALCRWEHVQ